MQKGSEVPISRQARVGVGYSLLAESTIFPVILAQRSTFPFERAALQADISVLNVVNERSLTVSPDGDPATPNFALDKFRKCQLTK